MRYLVFQDRPAGTAWVEKATPEAIAAYGYQGIGGAHADMVRDYADKAEADARAERLNVQFRAVARRRAG